jgi:D-arabinan exo alpha-(1,3)/(1,5)-arabinofuranosidase (non-reducing end)
MRRDPFAVVLCGAWLLTGPSEALAQAPGPGIPDPFGLLRPQDYVAGRSSSNNPDPESNDDSKRPIPGETVTLADLEGPGSVSHIWLTVADNEYGWPRLLRLRVYYDGGAEPSVDAPVGDFFAVGHGFERKVQSLMVRDGSEGRSRNSYWPMPFRKSCRITVTNEGRRRVANLYYQVDWQKLPSLPADTPYFHARYRQALPNDRGRPYEVLSVEGRGHYVGTVFSVVQAEAGWFGEGDDLFYVDGETRPSLEGTGTEDYFNDAWGLHVSEGAYTGVPLAEGTGLGSRMTAYRWHLPDPIPFRTSLRFVMEHKGWTFNPDGSVKSAFGERTDLLSSVAFWYQQGIARGLPEVPYGRARLPQGNALQIEVEKALDDAKAEKGTVSLSPDLFWSKDVLLFEAEGPGARLDVPFDVPADGDYELYAELAQGSDYGVYTALLDGTKPEVAALEHEPGADVRPQTQFDGYAPETYVGAAYQIGWPRLTKGRHTLTFVCLGKRPDSTAWVLGVDDLVLARTGAAAWAEATRVRAPQVPSGAALDVARGLTDPDPVTRGLAVLALRDRGPEARPALDALESALRDPDPNVRMASASAIAAIGPEAAPAVPALTAVCSIEGEDVQVLRACARALGRIGRPASPALPALRKLLDLPRVRWAAQEAIRRIE